jgi:hypothetical protein
MIHRALVSFTPLTFLSLILHVCNPWWHNVIPGLLKSQLERPPSFEKNTICDGPRLHAAVLIALLLIIIII